MADSDPVHDFKNQIGIVLGFTDLLLEDLSADDSRRGRLALIHQAANRALATVPELTALLAAAPKGSRQAVQTPRSIPTDDVPAKAAADLSAIVEGSASLLAEGGDGDPIRDDLIEVREAGARAASTLAEIAAIAARD